MNKKQELEYIAKYNIKNGTHFYNLEQIVNHASQNSKPEKQSALQRIGSALTQSEGRSATEKAILDGSAEATSKKLQEVGIDKESANQAVINPAYNTDKTTAALNTTLLTLLPDISAGIPGIIRLGTGMVGGYLGNRGGKYLDDKFGTSFLQGIGSFAGGLAGYSFGNKTIATYKKLPLMQFNRRIRRFDKNQLGRDLLDMNNRDRFIDENLKFMTPETKETMNLNSGFTPLNKLVHGDPMATGITKTYTSIGTSNGDPINFPHFEGNYFVPRTNGEVLSRYGNEYRKEDPTIYFSKGAPFYETLGKTLNNTLQDLKSNGHAKYLSSLDINRIKQNAYLFPTKNPYRYIVADLKDATGANNTRIGFAGLNEWQVQKIPMQKIVGFEYDPFLKTWAKCLYQNPRLRKISPKTFVLEKSKMRDKT